MTNFSIIITFIQGNMHATLSWTNCEHAVFCFVYYIQLIRLFGESLVKLGHLGSHKSSLC